jgi:septal ring factor EnvC (AmiA/AmiB activator)
MKKLILLAFVLTSCSQPETTPQESLVTDSTAIYSPAPEDTITILSTDSVMSKINNLINSTEHVDKKVKEIKTIKQENVSLKKELIETKAELEEVKAVLADTISEVKKKKRTFLQKVISTIKKDTVK